ncbi:hypothetical protein SAMN02745355_0154 [Picrophilus oshimae DSM 9789]|nr:hypothetical protein SAMN02745355_0154 [Picrophilus oshimae DSM 9789]
MTMASIEIDENVYKYISSSGDDVSLFVNKMLRSYVEAMQRPDFNEYTEHGNGD